MQPHPDVFCNSQNSCNADSPPDCPTKACYAKFWWNQPNVSWKAQCATTCGHEAIKYQTLVAEPGRGTRLQTPAQLRKDPDHSCTDGQWPPRAP
ncbi:hypothetical protein [Streptomyces xanthochromogenes]|uniref:hypothetical protein n=1 Tax=Streptomyces xanthochromogenes TaxID=67384 RepID=UPI00342E57FC